MINVYTPQLPSKPLDQCSDAERKIPQRCWDLRAVQERVEDGRYRFVFNASASKTMAMDLNWDVRDFKGFFQTLYPARFNDAEWVYSGGEKGVALKADSYLMGYDRFKGVENQKLSPWVYAKYTVKEPTNVVLVLSVHPSRY